MNKKRKLEDWMPHASLVSCYNNLYWQYAKWCPNSSLCNFFFIFYIFYFLLFAYKIANFFPVLLQLVNMNFHAESQVYSSKMEKEHFIFVNDYFKYFFNLTFLKCIIWNLKSFKKRGKIADWISWSDKIIWSDDIRISYYISY